jgi:hypothetical protein
MKMIKENISIGSARLAQAMFLLFFLPFILFVTYIVISKNFTIEAAGFLFIFIALIYLILKQMFSYADIYKYNHQIIAKKVFSTIIKSTSEIKSIEEAILPFTFYIIFHDNSKVYFLVEPTNLLRHLTSSDTKKRLRTLKEKLSKD